MIYTLQADELASSRIIKLQGWRFTTRCKCSCPDGTPLAPLRQEMVLLPDQHPQESIAPVISAPQAADTMWESAFSNQIHQGTRAFTQRVGRPGLQTPRERGQPWWHLARAGPALSCRHSRVA